jgi:hypothetical protein
MVSPTREFTLQSLHVAQEIDISAPVEIAFAVLLEELGPEFKMQDGAGMPLVLEAWPGGRWYRDLGNQSGHFWGVVQVIKPPSLIEISGPLFMSYPAVNHLQYRLQAEGAGTRLVLTHRGFGDIEPAHREGVSAGWGHINQCIKQKAEARR